MVLKLLSFIHILESNTMDPKKEMFDLLFLPSTA